MDYKNLKPYTGQMSSADLCEAIVEVRDCDIPEVRSSVRMLVDDLRDSILGAPKIFYLKNRL